MEKRKTLKMTERDFVKLCKTCYKENQAEFTKFLANNITKALVKARISDRRCFDSIQSLSLYNGRFITKREHDNTIKKAFEAYDKRKFPLVEIEKTYVLRALAMLLESPKQGTYAAAAVWCMKALAMPTPETINEQALKWEYEEKSRILSEILSK